MLSSVYPVEDRHKDLIQKLKEATETLGDLGQQAGALGIAVWLHGGTELVKRPAFKADSVRWDEAYQLPNGLSEYYLKPDYKL